MYKTITRIAIPLILALFVSACATTAKLSQEQVLNKYAQVAALDTALDAALADGADYLAPAGFADARARFDEAVQAAVNGKGDAANNAARLGLDRLQQTERSVAQSKELLREVLAARTRAMNAGAPTLYATNTAKMESELRDVATLVERDRIEDVKERRPALISGYEQLELVSLKRGVEDAARAALERAKQNNAQKYAPKTYTQSAEELALSLSMLDADRTKTEAAENHAVRAKWLAERSIAIAELIKDFDRRDYTREDIVLWHQAQLSVIGEPLGGNLPFNTPDRDVVLGMQSSVNELIRQRDDTAVSSSRFEQELSVTEEEKGAIDKVASMFAAFEASVYQQRKNVLISAHGFRFAPGDSELTSENFTLMNKIVKAINTFPGSNIKVSGHTDSTGSDALNQKLSEERAGNVARFLTEVGGISAGRVTAYGYGKSRPVANNETAEGRSANRRVEILIENP